MASPKPFSIGVPTVATEVPQKRQVAGKDYGPNLFLQPGTLTIDGENYDAKEGYLAASFDLDKWFDVPVQGHWEDDVIRKGARKGEPTRRMVGDAAEVTRQLREAAAQLGIGVSIKYVPEVYKGGAKKGQEVPDRIVVKYLGTARKQYNKDGEAEE